MRIAFGREFVKFSARPMESRNFCQTSWREATFASADTPLFELKSTSIFVRRRKLSVSGQKGCVYGTRSRIRERRGRTGSGWGLADLMNDSSAESIEGIVCEKPRGMFGCKYCSQKTIINQNVSFFSTQYSRTSIFFS